LMNCCIVTPCCKAALVCFLRVRLHPIGDRNPYTWLIAVGSVLLQDFWKLWKKVAAVVDRRRNQEDLLRARLLAAPNQHRNPILERGEPFPIEWEVDAVVHLLRIDPAKRYYQGSAQFSWQMNTGMRLTSCWQRELDRSRRVPSH
jgi:hypothetical protein